MIARRSGLGKVVQISCFRALGSRSYCYSILRVCKGDTRSLDYSSNDAMFCEPCF